MRHDPVIRSSGEDYLAAKSANAKSLLSVMALRLEPAMQINVTAESPDEKEAADTVTLVLELPENK